MRLAPLALVGLTAIGTLAPTQPPPSNADRVVLHGVKILAAIYQPTRVRAAASGDIYVLSRTDHAVHHCRRSEKGQFVEVNLLGQLGQGPSELMTPTDIAVSRTDGSIWVADSGNSKVVQFSSDGRFVRSFVVPSPISISVDAHNVYVVSTFAQELVTVWSFQGRRVAQVGIAPADAPGGDETKKSYNSRGHVLSSDSTLYYVFRSIVPPRYLAFRNINTAPISTSIAGPELRGLADKALAAATQPEFRYSAIVNGAALRPQSDELWVAIAAAMLYRFDKNGRQLGRYEVRADRPYPIGLHDLTFLTGHEVIGVSEGLGVFLIAVP